MGVRVPSQFSNSFIGPLPANATETVIITTPPLSIPLDFTTIFVLWQATIIPGTGTTSLQFQMRRGTTASGTPINANLWIDVVTAGSQVVSGGCYFDTPGPVAGQQYSLTCIQAGATVAGTFKDGSVLAFAL